MNRSDKAKATLDHEFIKGAIEEIRSACVNNIRVSQHDDQGLRDDMYYMLRCTDVFEKVLKSYINEGKVEKINEMNIKRMIR